LPFRSGFGRVSQETTRKYLVQIEIQEGIRDGKEPRDMKNIFLPSIKIDIVRPKALIIVIIGRCLMESLIGTKK